jgi:hypothetical protein
MTLEHSTHKPGIPKEKQISRRKIFELVIKHPKLVQSISYSSFLFNDIFNKNQKRRHNQVSGAQVNACYVVVYSLTTISEMTNHRM